MASRKSPIPGQLALFEFEQEQRADGSIVVRPRKLTDGREITVAAAARMLGYKDRHAVYRLIALGEIDAWKPATERGNGRWRIAWASVAEYKARRKACAQGADDGWWEKM